jgi:EmrB/QacA subfamily drug resistance transporter
MALPTITHKLNITSHQSTWIITMPLLIISGFLVLFGRLGDIYGKIKIFKIGALFFTLGSACAGFSSTLTFLIASRMFQAIGSAMTMSQSFGITAMIFTPDKRARAMALVAMFVSIGAVAGPGIGGFILQILPYNFIFFLNLPLGILSIFLSYKLLPKNEETQKASVDLIGFVLFFIFIIALFGCIESMLVTSNQYAYRFHFLVVAVIFLGVFIISQLKIKEPLLNLKIFNNYLFNISVLAALLVFVTNFFAAILFPFYLQQLRGLTPAHAGFIMMSWPITMVVMSPISGILGDKFNKEMITFISCLILLLGQFVFLGLELNSPYSYFICGIVLCSAGSSLFQTPNNALVMGTVESKFLGVAGAINALARNLGMLLGISLASLITFNGMSEYLGVEVSNFMADKPEAFIYGMHNAFKVAAFFICVILCLTGFRLFNFKK